MIPHMQAAQDMPNMLQVVVLTSDVNLCPAVCAVAKRAIAAHTIELACHQHRLQVTPLHMACLSAGSSAIRMTSRDVNTAASKAGQQHKCAPCSSCMMLQCPSPGHREP